MKIAYLMSNWKIPLFGPGGPSVHIQEVCRGLAERGHQVFIIAADSSASPATGPMVPVFPVVRPWYARAHGQRGRGHRSPGPGLAWGQTTAVSWSPPVLAADLMRHAGDAVWQRRYYRASRAILERERPDAIYERYERGSRAGDRLAHEFGIPLLVEVNTSLTFTEEWRHAHSPLYSLLARQLERNKFRAADRLLPVSPALYRYLLTLGVDRSRVEMVSAGAEPPRYAGMESQARALRFRNGLIDKIVVGYVGSFKPWIDLDLLIESATRIIGSRHDVHFVLVGDGEQRPQVESRIAEAGVSEYFTITDFIPPDEVPPWLATIDVAVAPYPALASFHFTPMKHLEYMAAGRAVVATRSESTELIVDHTENGVLVHAGDIAAFSTAVLELAADREQRERLGNAARRKAEARFSWRRQVERIERQLESAVEERGGRYDRSVTGCGPAALPPRPS